MIVAKGELGPRYIYIGYTYMNLGKSLKQWFLTNVARVYKICLSL